MRKRFSGPKDFLYQSCTVACRSYNLYCIPTPSCPHLFDTRIKMFGYVCSHCETLLIAVYGLQKSLSLLLVSLLLYITVFMMILMMMTLIMFTIIIVVIIMIIIIP